MDIVQFRPDDYEEVLYLWKITKLYLRSTDSREQINFFLSRNPETSVVMKDQGKILGVLLGGYDGRRAYLHHLAVLPSYQKQGIGKTLVKYAISQFSAMNVPKIHLFIEKSNIEVVKFYKKLGAELRDDLLMMSFVL